MMSGGGLQPADRLNELLREAGLGDLPPETSCHFAEYLSLILRWNSRTNLTSVRDPGVILARHFVESIACARALPAGIASLLDFGSGAGFPGLPIALCRPEIAVTLAESQGKKAAFLREAVRSLGVAVQVHGGRAEAIATSYACVTLRAVDRMEEAVAAASTLLKPAGWLALMTSHSGVDRLQTSAGPGFSWSDAVPLPGSESRILSLGQKLSSAS